MEPQKEQLTEALALCVQALEHFISAYGQFAADGQTPDDPITALGLEGLRAAKRAGVQTRYVDKPS